MLDKRRPFIYNHLHKKILIKSVFPLRRKTVKRVSTDLHVSQRENGAAADAGADGSCG